MLHKDDRIRLQHMLDAARQAQTFIAHRQPQDLTQDTMLAFALVRAIEVIGEAAGKVSPAGRAAVPALPWAAIIGMRNRLIHAYFEIDEARVWATVTEDLPPLITQLVDALATADD